MNKKDRELINKLVSHFERVGVIRSVDESFLNDAELDVVLEEAYADAKSENLLNPAFYDSKLEDELSGQVKDNSNPMVNGYWD